MKRMVSEMNENQNNPEMEESDIIMEQLAREKREREKRKQEEAIILMLQNEVDSLGYPLPADDEAYRYDLGGDEWIDSITGADTWYRQNEHRLPKRQVWRSGAD